MAHGEGFCLALGEYSDAIPLCREDMTQCRTNGRIKRRPIKKAIEAAGAGSRRIKRKRGRILGGRIFLTNWFLEGMKWIFQNVAFQHTVLTIIICTLVLKGVTLFSDIKTRKSTAKMSALQPELDKINSKYRDNPQKLQIEQRKLMKTAGVSMWSSCLPMLITLPLFICFFNAFRYWGHEQW